MDHREQLPIGAELVGDYRIDGVLGQGGFAVTYSATDLVLGKTVAIKEYFPTEFATRDNTLTIRPKSERHGDMFDWGRKRFLDEAQTLVKFSHPAIVHLQRFFEALNTGYMVLEFEDGKSLKCWCDDLGRPATQAELDGIVPPLLDALGVMHAANFIHRDIAPDNIIIRPDGSPVLLDFGAARQAIAVETKTLTGIIKAGYSPPEQYLTDASLQGPWTDAYALGATFYRVVTGADPPEAPARQIKETYVPAASASQGEYRPAFLAALDWSLQLKMEERPQSILAFQEALSGGQNVSERVATPEAMSGRQRTSETAPVSLAPQPPHGNRGLALKWAAALIVIVGGIGGYLAYLRWSDDQAWEEATTKTVTIGKLEGYLKTFPNGRHAKEARQRVAEINRAQRKRADEQAWQEATRSDTVEAYKAYLKVQPKGIFKDAARARFEAIWAEVRRKAEEDRKRAEAERQREEAERKRAEEVRKRAEALRNENLGCWNSSGNRSLRACTRIIVSKSLYRKHFGADDLAKVYSNRGVEYGAKGQLTRAIADYTQAIKLNPRYADAYNNRSFSYAKKGQYDRAIADASQAIQINPRHALAYVNRGNAYGRKGYRRKAIADFRKALQIDPSDRLAKRNLKILGVRP